LGTTKPACVHPNTEGARPTFLPIPGFCSRPFSSPRRGDFSPVLTGFNRSRETRLRRPGTSAPLASLPRRFARSHRRRRWLSLPTASALDEFLSRRRRFCSRLPRLLLVRRTLSHRSSSTRGTPPPRSNNKSDAFGILPPPSPAHLRAPQAKQQWQNTR
jgi:hypothetical protein